MSRTVAAIGLIASVITLISFGTGITSVPELVQRLRDGDTDNARPTRSLKTARIQVDSCAYDGSSPYLKLEPVRPFRCDISIANAGPRPLILSYLYRSGATDAAGREYSSNFSQELVGPSYENGETRLNPGETLRERMWFRRPPTVPEVSRLASLRFFVNQRGQEFRGVPIRTDPMR